jgi:PPOX class probable F420-dependent enzyme
MRLHVRAPIARARVASHAMPTTPLSPAHIDFLRRPNPAVVSSLKPSGSPHSAVTWYLWDEHTGGVVINMAASRKRLEYMRRDPRVSLTILDGADWYSFALTLEGRVERFEPDVDLAVIDRMSIHFTGEPYLYRDGARINAVIAVERWHAVT